MFRRVITNIDKFASGSYKKPVDKPGAQSGPIVSVIPSLFGGRSKDTANGTSPPASGLPPSSPSLPSVSAGTSSLVKSVGTTLTSIWAHAFPLNLKAGPPRRPTAANTAPSSTPQQAPGGITAASSDRTSVVSTSGGPPIPPPLPAEGSPATGTSRGPKIFGQIPGLSSALAFRSTLMKLRGKGSASGAPTGSPVSPVAEINAVEAGSIKEGVPGASGGTSGTNAVETGGGLPAAVPPASLGSNDARPTSALPQGAVSGLLSTIGLGGTLATIQGENTRPGLLGRLISSATPTNVRNAASISDATSGSVGGMSQPNANIVRGPPLGSTVTTQGSGNINMTSGPSPGLGSSLQISRLRTTAALRNAINKWKHRNPASNAAPRIPSSPAVQSTAVKNTGMSEATSSIPQANTPAPHRAVPTMPSLTAPRTSNEVPASVTQQGGRSAGIISGLSSAIGIGGILSTSRGRNAGSSTVPKSTNTSASEINAGNARSNNELSVTAGSVAGTNTNHATSPSNPTPVTTPGRSGNENAASGAPRVTLSQGATSERSTVVAVNKTINEPEDAKTRSDVAPANPSFPEAATGLVNPSVAPISPRAPSGALRAPGVEIIGRPASVSHLTAPETPREPHAPRVSSLMPGGAVTPSAMHPVPESSSSVGSSKATGSILNKTPHETPSASSAEGEALKQPANATASLGPSAGGEGGAGTSTVSTATSGTEETLSRAPSVNVALPPDNALPASKPEEIPATVSETEGRSTLLSRLQNVRAAVTSPVTGGAEASRTFVRNLFGMGMRRRLTS
ncbi:mucin-19 isoform X2 [Rhipicephalus sanguineus]|nr:mucin-19 isoform X2 [Rhipicephalus sanguineus]